MAECLEKYPDRFISTMGKVDPRRVDEIVSEIDLLVNEYSCSGIKIEVPDVPFYMDDPEYDGCGKKSWKMD